MLGRGGTFVNRVYMNYNGVFGKNIASIIEHCIIENHTQKLQIGLILKAVT